MSARVGAWVSMVGTKRSGAIEERIEATERSESYLLSAPRGREYGTAALARGELAFYKNEISASESFFIQAINEAREGRQPEIKNRALFYQMRVGFLQGDLKKAENALTEMEKQLDEECFATRYAAYDAAFAWYYLALKEPKKVPEWLKGDFVQYSHPGFFDNFANQARARYYYAAKKYRPLLEFYKKRRGIKEILFGETESKALEALCNYRLKREKDAIETFKEAYELSLSNNLIVPFVELGKDMRTLTASLMRKEDVGIPEDWLESINRKASAYAKRQAHIISKYKLHSQNAILLTEREKEVLKDFARGFTRAEIAENQRVPLDAVKLAINMIYTKLGADNLADVIRIAAERKLI
jgi:LuxR family maltose regulon positive regulatory protein